MKHTRTLMTILTIMLLAAPAAAKPPAPGDTLPDFTMPPLAVAQDRTTLGLQTNAPFSLADIDAPYVLVEIIGVYCPICHEQAPSLTRLHKRLKKNRLDGKIKMLGIAAGGTPMEVKHIRKQDYRFPVAHDTDFKIYNALSKPRTPFTLIVDKQGKVLYTHRGKIPKINALFKKIKTLVK